MAKAKKEWKLEQHVGSGLITTEPFEVKVKGKNGGSDQTGTIQVVARILIMAAFVKVVEAIVNEGRKASERVNLTFEWLLTQFVNNMLVAQERSRLNKLADPTKAIVVSVQQMMEKFSITDEAKIRQFITMLAPEVLKREPSDEEVDSILAECLKD